MRGGHCCPPLLSLNVTIGPARKPRLRCQPPVFLALALCGHCLASGRRAVAPRSRLRKFSPKYPTNPFQASSFPDLSTATCAPTMLAMALCSGTSTPPRNFTQPTASAATVDRSTAPAPPSSTGFSTWIPDIPTPWTATSSSPSPPNPNNRVFTARCSHPRLSSQLSSGTLPSSAAQREAREPGCGPPCSRDRALQRNVAAGWV